MSCHACRYFDECSAPICPEDPASLKSCAWFPDEEVCRRQDHASIPMVKAQKRIARATGKDIERGCFTVEMLARVTTIGRGIRGLDPETPVTRERVTKWLSGFKGRKALTDEQRAVLRARALKMRARKQGQNVPDVPGSKAPEPVGLETASVQGVGP